MGHLRSTVAHGTTAAAYRIWRMKSICPPRLAAESACPSLNLDVIHACGFVDPEAEPVILTAADSGDHDEASENVDKWTNTLAHSAGGPGESITTSLQTANPCTDQESNGLPMPKGSLHLIIRNQASDAKVSESLKRRDSCQSYVRAASAHGFRSCSSGQRSKTQGRTIGAEVQQGPAFKLIFATKKEFNSFLKNSSAIMS